MQKALTINKTIRNNYKKIISSISDEDLVKIPEGCNNHILWNFGHAIVTQNILCYKLSGNEFTLDNEIIERYRKGSQPEAIGDIEAEKLLLLKLADETLSNLESDLTSIDFTKFTEYETSFGYTIQSIEEALNFNNVHEGLHLGYIMSQKRALGL